MGAKNYENIDVFWVDDRITESLRKQLFFWFWR